MLESVRGLESWSVVIRAQGGVVRSAGFDEEAGVFRIFDVWKSRDAWDASLYDRLMPVVQTMMMRGGRAPENSRLWVHESDGRRTLACASVLSSKSF
jgi:hypothetical protein